MEFVTHEELAAFEERIAEVFTAIEERVSKLESIVSRFQQRSPPDTSDDDSDGYVAPDTLRVHIKTIAGELPPVQISCMATVADLKRKLVHQESVSKRRRLVLPAGSDPSDTVLGTELMDETKTLQECGVQNDAVLGLVVDDFHTINQTEMRVLQYCMQEKNWDFMRGLINKRRGLLVFDVDSVKQETDARNAAYMLNNNRSISELKLVHSNRLSDGLNSIFKILSLNSSIASLDLSKIIPLDLQQYHSLGKMLRCNSSLTSLDLSRHSMDICELSFLIDGIKENTHLTKLNLMGCKLQPDELTFLCNFLVESTVISDVSLAECGINAKTAPEIARVLRSNTSITSLNLSHNELKSEGAKSIAEALASNTTLTSLDLQCVSSHNCTGLTPFIMALEKNHALKSLSLFRNSMNSTDAEALLTALQHNVTLVELAFPQQFTTLAGFASTSLSKVRFSGLFSAADFISLTNVLKKNQTITDMDLTSTILETDLKNQHDGAMIGFADMLRSNKSLLCLGLSGILTSDAGTTAVFEALQVNSTLTKISANNSVHGWFEDRTYLPAIVNLVEKNTSIKVLDIGGNHFQEHFSLQVAEALLKNTTLTDLNFSNAKIRDQGAIAFANLLRDRCTLKSLNLAAGSIGRRGIMSLVQALKQNKSLTHLWISSNEETISNLDFLFCEDNLKQSICNVEVMSDV